MTGDALQDLAAWVEDATQWVNTVALAANHCNPADAQMLTEGCQAYSIHIWDAELELTRPPGVQNFLNWSATPIRTRRAHARTHEGPRVN